MLHLMNKMSPPLKAYKALFEATFPELTLSGLAFEYTEKGEELVSFSIVSDSYITNRDRLIKLKSKYQPRTMVGMALLAVSSLYSETSDGKSIIRFQLKYSKQTDIATVMSQLKTMSVAE